MSTQRRRGTRPLVFAEQDLPPRRIHDDARRDHLVPLPGSDWALWRRVGLRGAGFPAELARRLSFPECAAAAAAILAAEALRDAAQEEARGRLNAALDALRQAGRWDDKERRKPLLDGLRALNQSGPAALPPAAVEVVGAACVAALVAAAERVLETRSAYAAAYASAVSRQSEEIHRICGLERFREAVLWQNRGAFRTAVEPLLRNSPQGAARNSQRRQHEELIASYVQRYALKNDTIGFFGPMAWASFSDRPLRVRVGPELVIRREVFLETWCIEELAKTLARDPVLRPWLAPRLMPYVRLQGLDLHLPFQRPMRLPPDRAALLRACRGDRTARAIAVALCQDRTLGLRSEREVYRLLEQLAEIRLVDWSLQVPIHPWAWESLREEMMRVADPRLRGAALDALRQLDLARQAVAAAAGDVPALDRALGDLEATFQRLTGTSGTRRSGELYAGRTLVYEDCLRDLETEIGPEVLEALAGPLSLVLSSARWFTFHAAELARKVLAEVYRELVRHDGSRVELVHFWYRFQTLLFEQKLGLADTVVRELHRLWEEILGIDPAQRRLQLASAELAPRVATAFAAPRPGWPYARFHNPDVLIAAESVEALARGELELVLGELHAAACSLNAWVFMALCPQCDAVFGDLEADLPEPRVVFLEPRNLPRLTGRTRRACFSPKDVFILPLQETVPTPAGTVFPMSALVVQESDEGLVVCSRDGHHRWDIVDFFGDLLSGYLATEFGLLGPSRHWPRVTVDRMVIWRESWSFAAAELEFCSRPDAADRFLEAQRWARRHALPRTVFVKVPVEEKPFYVDFDSPVYVDLLARAVRRTAEALGDDRTVRLSEMLPGPDQVWLPDAAGRRHTSELRVVVVDRAGAADRPGRPRIR